MHPGARHRPRQGAEKTRSRREGHDPRGRKAPLAGLGAQRPCDAAPKGLGGSGAVVAEKARAQGALGRHLTPTLGTLGQVGLQA